MYRQYRIGDFPDVQITSADILLPLQELAKRDSYFGRMLLHSIYTGIIDELEAEPRQMFISEVNSSVEAIFKNSQLCDSSIMGSIFEIALENAALINIGADVISRGDINIFYTYYSIGIILFITFHSTIFF